MQKKSFHKSAFDLDKQRIGCERTFSAILHSCLLSDFFYKIQISVSGMFRFAEKAGQGLAEGVHGDVLNPLGVHRSQFLQDDVGGQFLSLFIAVGSSEV